MDGEKTLEAKVEGLMMKLEHFKAVEKRIEVAERELQRFKDVEEIKVLKTF